MYAYFTVPSEDEIVALNLTTDKFSAPIRVGTNPQGLDVTPNGKYLYVADFDIHDISKVNLSTGRVTAIPTAPNVTPPYSISVVTNDEALYTTSTPTGGDGRGATLYELNLETGSSNRLITGLSKPTYLPRSWDRAVYGLVEGDTSGGTVEVLTSAANLMLAGGSTTTFLWNGSLDRNGRLMLVEGVLGSFVIDIKHDVQLGIITGQCRSAVLNASGSMGYCLKASAIVELNIERFLPATSIPLPAGTTGGSYIAISSDGKYLVADTTQGAVVVDL